MEKEWTIELLEEAYEKGMAAIISNGKVEGFVEEKLPDAGTSESPQK